MLVTSQFKKKRNSFTQQNDKNTRETASAGQFPKEMKESEMKVNYSRALSENIQRSANKLCSLS